MTSIEEFIKTRESIEKLAAQVAHYVECKDVRESRMNLEDAHRQLKTLKGMITNNTQEMVGRRLSAELASLDAKIEKIGLKTSLKRKVIQKEQSTPVRRFNTDALEIVVFERP